MKITLVNNTDYRAGVTFKSIPELREFVSSYYRGEPGNLYSESWTVEGDYPEEIFEILDPPEIEGMDWQLK